jgi:hypothetical protein
MVMEYDEAEAPDNIPDQDATVNTTEPGTEKKMIQRGEPEISESRKRLVTQWLTEVRADKKHWAYAFAKMRLDQDFCYGRQWSKESWEDDRYTANITLRHVQQRVAALYAKNPKVAARRRTRLMSTAWDGTMSAVMLSMQQLQMAQEAGDLQMAQQPMQVMQDAQQVTQYKDQMDKFGRTLELLYDYNIDEQVHPFKIMMKLMVRRAVTTGVGYSKIGFQRVMELGPELEAQIADITQRMATMERSIADVADGEQTDQNAAEMESLRLQMQAMQAEEEQVVREGIIFDYPDSTSIIPDRKTRQLREFLGSDHVTQEYILSPNEVKEIYGVDVHKGFRAYRPGTTDDPLVSPLTGQYDQHTDSWQYDDMDPSSDSYRNAVCLVWETYDRKTGLVYITCDGYKDFLREPAAPEVWIERFFPWFPLVLNECDHPKRIYPPSDVELIRDAQREYNRLREGLREHRIANRPATAVAAGALSEEDVDKMEQRPPNALIEIDGLQPGQKVDDLIQPMRGPGLDPNLYEVNGIFEDILRTVGVQEANLGAVSGGTATESSIAESSRQSSMASNVDDLDDILTQMARSAGQIMLAEVSEETVKEVVGPGAVWPEMTRDQLAKEIFLEIEAGSTGKPNQAQEIQNFERLAPILMQIPGITPEMLAKEALRRLDDRLELDDVFDQNMLSIQAMNQAAGQQPGPEDPAAQGGEGANNAEQTGAPAGASSEGTVQQQVQ